MNAEDWLGDIAPPARAPGGRKRDRGTGRLRKLLCEECGFISYSSRGALERAGRPVCGCGGAMVLANLRDRAELEWETLAQELGGQGNEAWNAAMRELGATDLVVPLDKKGRVRADRRSGAGQHRCQWDGGYCMVYVDGRYCDEHAPASSRRAA